MITTLSEDCSAIAFYGIDPAKESLAHFYNVVTAWFKELGCHPDKLSMTGDAYSRGWRSYKNANALLLKNGFDGIKALSVVALAPNWTIPIDDYVAIVSFSVKYAYVNIVCRSSLAQLSTSSLQPIAENILQRIKIGYGIGYNRLHRLGPAPYAVGMCQGIGPSGIPIRSQLSEAEKKKR